MSKRILIIAGESSGDLYGAHLINALKALHPGISFVGIGGPKMKDAGVEILFPIDELSIIGIPEIITKWNVLRNAFSVIKKKLDEETIDLAILINYPGFNLKISPSLKAKGIPVIFYSSPQVWAWAKWRINTIKRFVDKMIVFFKFEEDFYKKNGVDAEFVGHPLVDIVKAEGHDIGLKKDGAGKIVSLVPGSRKSEINNLFETMLGAAKIMHKKDAGLIFLITKHPQIPAEIYLKRMRKYNLPMTLIDGNTYDCLNASRLAVVVSGSVTLEATILKTPMIIVNRISAFNALIYILLVRLANVGLVNIVAGRRVMPELLQFNATPKKIAAEALDMLNNKERSVKMKEDLESVNKLVGAPGASNRAAKIISGYIK